MARSSAETAPRPARGHPTTTPRAGARITAGSVVVVLVALAAVLGLSNRWVSWEAGVGLLKAADVSSYEAIAEAAPGLPTADLPAQHARRFPLHTAIGTVSEATGIGLHAAYRGAWALLAVAIVIAVHLALRAVGVRPLAYAVVMWALVTSAYAFRYYAIVPAVAADLLFVGGLSATLVGLLTRRVAIVCVGVVVAALGRETILGALPAIVAWLWLGPGWTARSARARLGSVVLVVAPAVATLVVLGAMSARFSLPASFGFSSTPALPAPRTFVDLTLLGAFASLPGSAGALAGHGLRVLVPHLPALALLTGVLRATARGPRRFARPSRAVLLPLAIWALIVAQPLALSPAYSAANETRTSTLALVALLVALAAALRDLERQRPLAPPAGALVLGAVLLGATSLHHVYTVIGPATATAFVAGQLALAGALAVVTTRAVGGPRASAAVT